MKNVTGIKMQKKEVNISNDIIVSERKGKILNGVKGHWKVIPGEVRIKRLTG